MPSLPSNLSDLFLQPTLRAVRISAIWRSRQMLDVLDANEGPSGGVERPDEPVHFVCIASSRFWLFWMRKTMRR